MRSQTRAIRFIKRTLRRLVPVGVLLALMLGGCSADGQTVVRLTDGDAVAEFQVEVAATDSARAQGLMGRTELAEDAGMLFVWPRPRPLQFWMKNTLIPLDIAFIREGRVVQVATMQPCRADPCPLTDSGEPADMALEVNAGTFDQLGIGAGAKAEILGRQPSPS